uniref:Uncharacterized protein n=1 Tax=Anguilla anguilla TaxID=7936 RepID=A0A0E9R8F3_ANGAN
MLSWNFTDQKHHFFRQIERLIFCLF